MRKKEVFRTVGLPGKRIDCFDTSDSKLRELLQDVRMRLLAKNLISELFAEDAVWNMVYDRKQMLANERRREDHHCNLQQFYLYSGQIVFLPHARSVWVPR